MFPLTLFPYRLAEEGNLRQKLSIEKSTLENKLKGIEETLTSKEETIAKVGLSSILSFAISTSFLYAFYPGSVKSVSHFTV